MPPRSRLFVYAEGLGIGSRLGGLGSVVSSPNGAPTENEFVHFKRHKTGSVEQWKHNVLQYI